ncbi:hypothetical protein NG896_00740 [Aeromonas veronii]|uniref:hypothetical protein n=1 Tax=Aeromonas veronii TaxID=654 RepID=UPI0020914486|nr:hypothetical protein [Aeromonas veronii]MCO5341079.1 hypothetical protein [Aeromonas veronii]
MCNCQTMARDLSETLDERFPPSTHAPKCEDFRQLEFTCIKFDNASLIVPADERDGVLENIDGPHHFETVMLTQDQFDKLPEWEG